MALCIPFKFLKIVGDRKARIRKKFRHLRSARKETFAIKLTVPFCYINNIIMGPIIIYFEAK